MSTPNDPNQPASAYPQQPPAPNPAYGQPPAYGQQTAYGRPQQPAYGQGAYGQPPYGYPAYQPVPTDPGQLLNILSLVAIFVMPIAGIFLGAFGRKQSRAAGFPGTMGTVGMWVNIALTALSVLFIVVWLIFFFGFLATAGTLAGTSGAY
ncbi:hypothetical protein ET445_05090 [Agromyces protaetiae]|uniref:DUF4190 domain-containing protein n=1 Tax=Agromyces protaetiae TaxID=2509455 RepID=A0A4P6F9H3_9MICO|nr:hypothetical protein [Agromyces protaetiae]QAY72810.1 hypothetical protein ET445_05090 [Agromyces protaetiae]